MFHRLSPAPPAGGPGYAFTNRWLADRRFSSRHGPPAEPENPGQPEDRLGPVLTLGAANQFGVETVRRSGRAVLDAIGIGRCYAVSQVHGRKVLRVGSRELDGWGPDAWLGDDIAGRVPLPTADALVTGEPGVALLIRTADCLPVVFSDADAGVVGVAHAGRVGLAAGILIKTVAALRELGADAPTAVIGPAICGGCYEVPVAMRAAIADQLPKAYAKTRWGTASLDLVAAARHQLIGLGCAVDSVAACTRCAPGLHSYRRDASASGRLGAFAWLGPPP